MPKPKQFDIVEVSWMDAKGPSGELTLKAAMGIEPVLRKTLGYLVCHTTSKIVIAGTDDRGGDDDIAFTECTVIPAGWVEQIVVLKPVT